jgi:hypothetical protein
MPLFDFRFNFFEISVACFVAILDEPLVILNQRRKFLTVDELFL